MNPLQKKWGELAPQILYFLDPAGGLFPLPFRTDYKNLGSLEIIKYHCFLLKYLSFFGLYS